MGRGDGLVVAAWQIQADRQVRALRIAGPAWVNLAADGNRIVAWDIDGALRLGEFKRGKFELESKPKISESLRWVSLSHDGGLLAAIVPIGEDSRVDDGEVANTQIAARGPDEQRSCGLRVWDTRLWRKVPVDLADGDLAYAVFSPVTDDMAVVHWSGDLTLIDVQTRKSRRLRAVTRSVRAGPEDGR
jgi:hypothetical protein